MMRAQSMPGDRLIRASRLDAELARHRDALRRRPAVTSQELLALPYAKERAAFASVSHFRWLSSDEVQPVS